MKTLGSRLALLLVYQFKIMPWWAIRIDAKLLAFLLTYFFRYRRGVIRQNLNLVGASNVSVFGIYENLCLLALESLKLFATSVKSVEKRVKYENLELLDELHSRGKNVVFVGAHMANWELFSLALPQKVKYKTYAIYKRLNNRVFDKAIKKSRSRSGMEIVEMHEIRRIVSTDNNDPILCSLVFDQRPHDYKNARWTTFLGIETPVYAGMEKIAHKLDAAVVYAAITREEDGRYTMRLELVSEYASDTEGGEMIDKCLGILEKEIVKCPENWLWTHRRWKHKRPSGVELQERKITKFGGWC